MYNRLEKMEYESEGYLISIKPISAARASITFLGNFKVTRCDKTKKIVKLDIYSEKFIVGEELIVRTKLNTYYYKIGVIEHTEVNQLGDGNQMHVFMITFEKQTNSSLFLMPIIAGNTWMLSHLINAYADIHFDTIPDEHNNDRLIHLYYRYDGARKFYDFTKMIESNTDVVSTLDVDDLSVIISFKVPKRFEVDYDLILKSKYSKISNELKSKIKMFHNASDKSIIHHVLNKTKKRRESLEAELKVKLPEDIELWEAFDIEQESIGVHQLSEIVKTI